MFLRCLSHNNNTRYTHCVVEHYRPASLGPYLAVAPIYSQRSSLQLHWATSESTTQVCISTWIPCVCRKCTKVDEPNRSFPSAMFAIWESPSCACTSGKSGVRRSSRFVKLLCRSSARLHIKIARVRNCCYSCLSDQNRLCALDLRVGKCWNIFDVYVCMYSCMWY
jgi:hypothetical protein